MKTMAKTALIVLGVMALAACGSEAPKTSDATPGESADATAAALPAPETPAQPADEMVTKPDTGVDVKLPDVPVKDELVKPAPGNDKPATGQ